ncbi:hypothetical protein, partial [Malonomonas rubra]|uniref:hypothetical protein n=1 Tax=Malonomonas rubra TaxID=57040 RepID=UPI0026F23711
TGLVHGSCPSSLNHAETGGVYNAPSPALPSVSRLYNTFETSPGPIAFYPLRAIYGWLIWLLR